MAGKSPKSEKEKEKRKKKRGRKMSGVGVRPRTMIIQSSGELFIRRLGFINRKWNKPGADAK
jgi:hypothetical protein